MKVLLIGYFGYNNFGDELMLQNAIRHLLRSGIAKEIYIPLNNTTPSSLDRTKLKAFSIKGRMGKLKLLKNILKCRRIIWSGGTCLYESQNNNLANILFILLICILCKITSKSFEFASIGIGEIHTKTGRFLIKRILETASATSFREKDSFQKAKELAPHSQTFRNCGDIFFLQEESQYTPKPNKKTRRLTVGFAGVGAFDKNCTFINQTAKSLDNITESLDCRVLFIPMQIGDNADNALHKSILSKMSSPRASITTPQNVKETIETMSKCDFLIGMRLHAIAMSDLMNIPNIAIKYAPKVEQYTKKSEMGFFKRTFRTTDHIHAEHITEAIKKYRNNGQFLNSEKKESLKAFSHQNTNATIL